jgi:hypothetical protein
VRHATRRKRATARGRPLDQRRREEDVAHPLGTPASGDHVDRDGGGTLADPVGRLVDGGVG